jgi:hypothetical protein
LGSRPAINVRLAFLLTQFQTLNNAISQEVEMNEFIEVSPGKTLLERLEEKKHQLPIGIVKHDGCASCVKPFTSGCQPDSELHVAPDGLRQPILHVCPLCQACMTRYRSGEGGKREVLAAVGEFLAKEASK